MNEQVEALLRTLPRKVKVGAYDFRIRIVEGESPEWGEADVDTQTVSVWPEDMANPAFLVGIVLHELLHVIYHYESLEGKDEEAVVTGYEVGLISLYRDNPKLLTWIKKGLRPSPTSPKKTASV